MTAHHFEQFKKIYKDTQPPEYLKTKGWEDLSHRLPQQSKPVTPLWTYGFVYAGLMVLVTTGLVGAAQTATPGSALYPIKATSDHVLKSINNATNQELLNPVISKEPTKSIPPKHTPTPTIKKAEPTVTKKNETQSIPTLKKINSTSNKTNSNNTSDNGNRQVEGIKTENKNNGNSENKDKVNNGGKENKEQKQSEKQEQKAENKGQGNQKKN